MSNVVCVRLLVVYIGCFVSYAALINVFFSEVLKYRDVKRNLCNVLVNVFVRSQPNTFSSQILRDRKNPSNLGLEGFSYFNKS